MPNKFRLLISSFIFNQIYANECGREQKAVRLAGVWLSLAGVMGAAGGMFLFACLRPFQAQGNIGELQKPRPAVEVSDLLVVPRAISGRTAHGGPGVDPHVFCGGYRAFQQIFTFPGLRLLAHAQ